MFWRRRANRVQGESVIPDPQADTYRSGRSSATHSPLARKTSERIGPELTDAKELFAAKDYHGAVEVLSRIVDKNLEEAKRMEWAPAPHWYAELARAHEYLGELDVALAVLDRYERDAREFEDAVHAKIVGGHVILPTGGHVGLH